MEEQIQKILDDHCDWTPKRIEGLKKELLNLFSVTHRNIPTMEDIEKWNCPPTYLKDGKIMYRNWIDEETQFIHEMINDFNIAYYGG